MKDVGGYCRHRRVHVSGKLRQELKAVENLAQLQSLAKLISHVQKTGTEMNRRDDRVKGCVYMTFQ